MSPPEVGAGSRARLGPGWRGVQALPTHLPNLWREGQLHEEFSIDHEFDIVELEPRRAASPDAMGSGGSGSIGSGGSGGSGGGIPFTGVVSGSLGGGSGT